MVTLTTGQQALADEWREQNPQTPAAINAFYRTSQAMTQDLAEWHERSEARRAWTQQIVRLAQRNGIRSVLDIGCGRGDDLAALVHAGIDRLVGVEPNEAMHSDAFVAINPIGSGIQNQLWSSLDDVVGMFDLVLLMDVLEHLPDPVSLLNQVFEHVPIGGWLVEHTPTWDIANPTHLKSNWGWSPGHILTSHGFQQMGYDQGLRIWQRKGPKSATSQTALLVSYRAVAPETVAKLSLLHSLGNWQVHTQTNDALITRARSIAVSHWWRQYPSDVFLMIDSDIVFEPADAMRITDRCRNGYPIIAGAYAIRDGTSIASRIRPGESVTFTAGAEPVEIDYAATGFLAVHRSVIDAMIPTLPICHADQSYAFWPFFDTQIVTLPNGNSEYLSEDWDFCLKARDLGFSVYIDPSIRLGHLGLKEYRLEDVVSRANAAPLDVASISFQEAPR